MAKKSTYKPKTKVKYAKGGKNPKKNSYKDNKNIKEFGFFDDLLDTITSPFTSLLGISGMLETMGGTDEQMNVNYPTTEGGILGSAIQQQEDAGGTGLELAQDVGQAGPSDTLTDYLSDLESGDQITRPPDLTRTSITKPKKVSTEFVENTQDTIAQQTAGVLGDIGRTGKFSGIKDVLQSADQSAIAAQEKGAAMDADYQKQMTDIDKFESQALTDQEKFEQSQLTDIEKFEEGLTSQITQAVGGQEFAGEEQFYGLAGDAAIQSAVGGGELEASVLGGIMDLQGQEAAAWGDIISGGINAIIDLLDFSDEKLKKNIKEVGQTEDGIPIKEFEYKDDEDAPEGPGKYRGVVAQDLIGTEHEGAVSKIDKNTLGVNYDELGIALQKISGGKDEKEYSRNSQDKNMIETNRADVTPGKFSHEENPIDIVHKRDNGEDEKIGEMTGGEGIMPPKDMVILEDMVQEGDKDGVFEHMEFLLSRWEQAAKMHEEKKVPMQNSNELNRDVVRARVNAAMGAKMGYTPKSRIKYRS